MAHFIERLREKPEAYRRRFALISTSLVTAVIGIVWLTTISFGIGSGAPAVATSEDATAPSPLSAAESGLGSAYQGLKDQFNSFKSQYVAPVTPPPLVSVPESQSNSLKTSTEGSVQYDPETGFPIQ